MTDHDYHPDKFAAEFATPEGQLLWATLNQESVIARMTTASDLNQPALKPVEEILLEQLGEKILANRMKQMAGHMVRQIMERHDYEHDASDIKVASVPFYKASRYRRRDETPLYMFRSSRNPREIFLTNDRSGEKLPDAQDGGRWIYHNTMSSPIKAAIGYGFDLKEASKLVAEVGYFHHVSERVLRPA